MYMNNNFLLLLSISIISTIVIFYFRKKISNKLNIIDLPDEERKIHKKPTPLIGGIMIFIVFIILNLYFVITGKNISLILPLIIFVTFSFIIGLIDDAIKITSIKKLLLIGSVYLIIGIFEKSFLLQAVYSETFNEIYFLSNLSLIITPLCVLLLINALNLSDGINGLSIIISVFWLISFFNYFENTEDLYQILIILLFLILYFNYKNFLFMGDSGSIFLGSLISIFFISQYNFELSYNSNKSIEEIFLIFMLPGIDMIRLFTQRLLNRQNPFKPDKKHLHHLLINRFSLNKSLLIYTIFLILPTLLYKSNIVSSLSIIILSIVLYLLGIKIFYRNLYRS